MPSVDRPVFVVGCARSGTTLLGLMLHAHPRLAIPPENRFLMRTYDRRVAFGDPHLAETRDAVASFITSRPRAHKFRDLGIPAEQVRDRLHEVPPTIGSFLGGVLELYAQRNDRPRWGDKRPNYIQHLDRILALFPDAQILHLVRDGRDCVASLKRMSWWPYGTPEAIYKWIEAMHLGAEARARLPVDQYHELRYEDLVHDPASVLDRVCGFLGEDLHPAMLEPHRVASDEVPAYKDWHARTQQPVTTSTVGSWDGRLEPWELRLTEHKAAAELEAHGYELVTGRLRRRPGRQALRDWDASVERRLAWQRRERAAEERRRERYRWPVAAELTTEQRRLAAARRASATANEDGERPTARPDGSRRGGTATADR